MKWIEISIVVERVAIDLIATLFEQYNDNGFIEEKIDDKHTKISFFIESNKSKINLNTWVEYVEEILKQNNINAIDKTKAVIWSEDDWLNSWKKDVKPLEIIPNFVISPIWQDKIELANKKVYYYDSTISFGTGSHETTESCIKLLAIYGNKARSILDIGTGTGILLLAAHYVNSTAKLWGIDIDVNSVEQAKYNCAYNDVSADIIEGDLAEKFNDKVDLILANLTVDPLKKLLPIISDKLNENGYLIISGIVDERLAEIMPYITADWQIVEHIHKRNWHTMALMKKVF